MGRLIKKLKRKYRKIVEDHNEEAKNESRLVRAIKNTVFDCFTVMTIGSGIYYANQGITNSESGKVAIGVLLGMAGIKIYRHSIRRGFRSKSKY